MRRKIVIFSSFATVAAIALFAFLLGGRDKADGNRIERQTELWAHERLMRVRINAVATPFETDGCSGGMSAVWQEANNAFPALSNKIGAHPPWEQCCITHDKAYHNAADATDAAQSFDARLAADQTLSECVSNFGKHEPALVKQQYQLLADTMYSAVRLGGAPCSGLSWRWGYGLPNCHIGSSQ
jgi:hypothetical protein